MRTLALAGMLLFAACAPPDDSSNAADVEAATDGKADVAPAMTGAVLTMNGQNGGYSDASLKFTAAGPGTFHVTGKNFAYNMGYTIARESAGYHARGKIVGYNVDIAVSQQASGAYHMVGTTGGYDFNVTAARDASGNFHVTGESLGYEPDLHIVRSGRSYQIQGDNISYHSALAATATDAMDKSDIPVEVLLALGVCVGVH